MSLTQRIEQFRKEYVNSRPAVCHLRAALWTESHQLTEGEPTAIRRAKAFLFTCQRLPVFIYPDELIVGAVGAARRSGVLTPEFSWKWVEAEMDTFASRPQDPYCISAEQKEFLRKEIFPYWQGRSLEEAFLKRVPEETARLLIDTGVLDNDSKWRQAVGEITPDYEGVLFQKGYGGILAEAKEQLATLLPTSPEAIEKIRFFQSVAMVAEGIITLSRRYGEEAARLAAGEAAPRRQELLHIAEICRRVPEHPPETFQEALQFVWFVQLGGILSENPLALNLGRFDQYMFPYYEGDLKAGRITQAQAQELIGALWIKLSEWVWTISSNTAAFFAGYNQFQNLTVGGRTRDGRDATNELSYLCLAATRSLKTHQPGLSVRIHPDTPEAFFNRVAELVREGTGFPAIHNDDAGTRMLLNAGYAPEDARDWSNCGCVVPHFRKTGQWTSAVNVNFGAALEYALNQGKSRITGEQMGLPTKSLEAFSTFEEVKAAVEAQLKNLVRHGVTGSLIAQELHREMVPRPFLSTCVGGCLEKGKDLSQGGAKYNIGPVLTGIGLGLVANSLAVIQELVFERGIVTLKQLDQALNDNWAGHELLRRQAQQVAKYGNQQEQVDRFARSLSDFYYYETRQYRDLFGAPFNTAFMGISNYIPAGKVVGATPCGRLAGMPLTEGVSPYVGTDVTSPLSAMRSAAKINHEFHSGGTLLNLRLSTDLLRSQRGLNHLKAMVRGYFDLGAFHVQFNCISNETLRRAQADPEAYRDLLVRVAGYSTQFVNLSKEVQEAIIARHEHVLPGNEV